MKHLFMFIVVFSVTTVFSQIPTFGQYSNIRDQQFRTLHGITVWSNYWDTTRSAYVCKATINSERQGEDGFYFMTKEWIEKDNRVVENVVSFMFSSTRVTTIDGTAAILDPIMKLIDKQDGSPLIAVTPNISYRGDSAKRIKDTIADWCAETKTLPREIGFEWRHPTMYTLVHLSIFNLLGVPAIISTSRWSDTYIECKGFSKTTHNTQSNSVDECGLNVVDYGSGMEYAKTFVRIKMKKKYFHPRKSETETQWRARIVFFCLELCYRDKVWHAAKGISFFDEHEKHYKVAKQLVNEFEERDINWDYK